MNNTPSRNEQDDDFRRLSLTCRNKLIKLCVAALIVITAGCANTPESSDRNTTFSLVNHGGMGGSDIMQIRRRVAMPAFKLVDYDGRPFTLNSMQGKWTIMLFGYTHCPDFCPTTLMELSRAYRNLQRENPELAAKTQIVFVSVDPFRDSPEVLADYIAHFNRKFIAVSGTPEELSSFTSLLGVDYSYEDAITGQPINDTMHRPPHDYAVNHSGDLYYFDGRTRLAIWISPPHTSDSIVSVLERIAKNSD